MTNFAASGHKKRTNMAFIAGWYAGVHMGEQSQREALMAHPEMDYPQIDAYCAGSVDGAAGDTFRIDLIHAHYAG